MESGEVKVGAKRKRGHSESDSEDDRKGKHRKGHSSSRSDTKRRKY